MRTLLFTLAFFGSLASYAQRKTLFTDALPIYRSDNDFFERLSRESLPLYSIYGGWSGAYTTATAAGQSVPATQMWWVDNISLSATDSCTVAVQMTAGTIPGTVVPPRQVITIPKGGGSVVLPIQRFFKEGQGVNVSAVRAGGFTGFRFDYGVSGRRVSSDFNKRAERVILKVGDSISSGSGVTTSSQSYDFRLADSLTLATNKNWRIVHKSQGSFASNHAESLRNQSELDVDRADVILYFLGTNNTSAATYDTDLTAFIAWKKSRYPLALLVVIGPVLRTDSQETTNVTIRTNASTRVTNAADPRIVYVNFGALWTSGQQATFTTDNIHPNPAGHGLMIAALWTAFKANSGAWINLIK